MLFKAATLNIRPSRHTVCHAVLCRVVNVLCFPTARYLRTGRLDTLLHYDELSQEMQAKRVFQVSI